MDKPLHDVVVEGRKVGTLEYHPFYKVWQFEWCMIYPEIIQVFGQREGRRIVRETRSFVIGFETLTDAMIIMRPVFATPANRSPEIKIPTSGV